MRIRKKLLLAAFGGTIGAPTYAQTDHLDMALRAVARTCDARAGQNVSAGRLADAVKLETSTGLPNDHDVLDEIANPDMLVERATDWRLRIAAVRTMLLEGLAVPGTPLAKALTVSPPPPQLAPGGKDEWLFVKSSAYELRCAAAQPPKAAAFATLPVIAIRKAAAELAKVGDERKAAGSAQLSFERLRSTNLAGDEKRTGKLAVNAALGVSLGGNEDRNALGYAEYSRSRVRIKTSPTPTDPGKNGKADDVDALEVGLLGTSRLANAVRATGRGGVIFDWVTDARYLTGALSVTPITGGRPNLGLCNLGSFRLVGLGIEGLCSLKLEADARYVIKDGSATLTEKDTIVAAGPVLGLTLRRSLGVDGKPRDGLVGSVTYRYLPVVTGAAPDIDRLDASLTYRWWSDDVGFDFGLTFADGIERKSLADENRIGFTFGILF